PLSTIFYTSGSTGTPKGAMYRERMILTAWQGISPTPVICVNYMPMNHAFGRSMVFTTLGNGGTCYFTAKSHLSTFFDDIRMVRPTQMSRVPRIIEMIFQHYKGEVERRQAAGMGLEEAQSGALAETRDDYLGGRILFVAFGSAPISLELRAFI